MAKYLIWYKLQLKAWCKNRLCRIQLIVLSALLLVVMNISFPDKDNMTAGIYCRDASYLEQMTDAFQQRSAFSFLRYTDEKKMQEDVLRGKLECAFSVDKDIYDKLLQGETKALIDYYCTPLTTKGNIMRETVYSVVYDDIARAEMLKRIPEFYSPYEDHEAIRDELLESYQKYLSEDNVYNMNVTYLDITPKTEKPHRTFLIHGIVGLVIFMTMLMGSLGKSVSGVGKVERALCRYHQRIFEGTHYLAVATPQVLLGLCMNIASREIAAWWLELPAMIFFLAFSTVWTYGFRRLFRSDTTFAGFLFVLVAVNLILCPIFFEPAAYFPALRFLRLLLPLGAYLSIL